MATVILDQHLAQSLIADRKRLGQDRYDEVWEGTYRMAPAPNSEHSRIVSRLCRLFQNVIEDGALGEVHIGVNVSDRIAGWDKNYRIPDLSVMLCGGKSVDHDTFWLGGPDFVVEVCSPDEDPYEKISFYESIEVRELLIIDRDPWELEIFRLAGGKLALAADLSSLDGEEIASEVIPFAFRLAKGSTRPGIAVRNTKTGETNTI